MQAEVMTPEQVAEFLQIDKDTVYQLIRDGELAAVYMGRAYRISRDDFDAYLMANRARPEIRKALFDRIFAYAERENPGVDSDEILEELERMDEKRKQRRSAS